MEWWKTEVIYQIYPRSFNDSNGDGIGDIEGITQRLDYLEWLGIKAVWLSPIYKSPMADFGYDVSDHQEIDPIFGSLDDLRRLLDAMHEKGMHLIMDFIPNHTSDAHEWFRKSRAREAGFEEFYVWLPGGTGEEGEPIPPNNWESHFGGSMWTWCSERREFYLHHFLPQQPDLNFRCPAVREAVADILRFWLSFGVDGFRADAVDCLVEDAEFPDKVKGQPDPHEGCPETFHVVKEWTDLAMKYGCEHKKDIFFTTEAYCKPDTAQRYFRAGVSFPFNFNLIDWLANNSCQDFLRKKIDEEMVDICGGEDHWWPNWVLGNHDQPRVASRLATNPHVFSTSTDADTVEQLGIDGMGKVAAMLLLLLPGTPTFYYGDELGLSNVKNINLKIADAERVDVDFRDKCRTPMPWTSDDIFAGFSTAKPWLPLNSDWGSRNVESQRNDPESDLLFFRRLLALRSSQKLLQSHPGGRNLVVLESGRPEILMFLRPSWSSLVPFALLVVLHVGPLFPAASVRVPSFALSFGASELDRGRLLLDSADAAAEPRVVSFGSLRLRRGQGLVLRVGPIPGPHHRDRESTVGKIMRCSLM